MVIDSDGGSAPHRNRSSEPDPGGERTTPLQRTAAWRGTSVALESSHDGFRTSPQGERMKRQSLTLACWLSAIVACGGPEPPGSTPPPDSSGPPPCIPPPLLVLANIPDDPTLDDGDPETLAIFEVNGHDLIGKFVRDPAAAESG